MGNFYQVMMTVYNIKKFSHTLCFYTRQFSANSFSKNIIRATISTNRRYETMLILRPDIPEEDKNRQLVKFEALLANEGAQEVDTIIKGRQRMSYPMKGYRDGLYILYRYNARAASANSVQNNLAKPDAET